MRVFEQLLSKALKSQRRVAPGLVLAGMLGMLSWDSRVAKETSQQLEKISAAVIPRVIYLRVDPDEALMRALDERGTVWFNRHVGMPYDEPVTESMVKAIAATSRVSELARIDALAGWATTYIDGGARKRRSSMPFGGPSNRRWGASPQQEGFGELRRPGQLG